MIKWNSRKQGFYQFQGQVHQAWVLHGRLAWIRWKRRHMAETRMRRTNVLLKPKQMPCRSCARANVIHRVQKASTKSLEFAFVVISCTTWAGRGASAEAGPYLCDKTGFNSISVLLQFKFRYQFTNFLKKCWAAVNFGIVPLLRKDRGGPLSRSYIRWKLLLDIACECVKTRVDRIGVFSNWVHIFHASVIHGGRSYTPCV